MKTIFEDPSESDRSDRHLKFSLEFNIIQELSAEELRKLCGLKESEVAKILDEFYGGAGVLSKRLRTSLMTGLDETDQKDKLIRVKRYGKNEIQLIESQSFWSLLWQALKDPTLIILFLCGVISIALSFFITDEFLIFDTDGSRNSTNIRTTKSKMTVDDFQWIEGLI